MMGAIEKFFKGLTEDKSDDGNAIDMLKADHRRVKELVHDFERAQSGAEKQKLLNTIIKELTVHTVLEEEFVYPILDKLDHDGSEEAVEEHHVVKLVLEELSNMSAEAETVATKVKVLWEMVQHHIKEEETDLLPKVKWSGEDMQELGKRMAERKQQLTRPLPVRSKVARSAPKAKAKSAPRRKTPTTRRKAS